MPIASGVPPQSQRKRRAGFGRMSVKGPGRSARTVDRGSAAKLRNRVEDRVEVCGHQGERHRSRPPLQSVQIDRSSFLVSVGDEPVHGVRREYDGLAGAVSRRPRRRSTRTPGSGSRLPALDDPIAKAQILRPRDVLVAERAELGRDVLGLVLARFEHEPPPGREDLATAAGHGARLP